MAMNISIKDRGRLRKLHALMGSDNPGEARNARKKILELLARHKAAWSDIPDLLQGDSATGEQPSAEPAAEKTVFDFNPLDLVRRIVAEYVSLTEPEYIAVTLWIAHTHVYASFNQTPRLFLTSPVRGCGKTTLLSLIEKLVPNAERIDGISDAGLFHILEEGPTLLLDEVDNADLPNSSIKRRVLNAGHRRGTKESRMMNGALKHYSLFAPVALAAIKRLHMPLMDRSIVVRMERSKTKLCELNTDDDPALIKIRVAMEAFLQANSKFLNTRPELPAGFENRLADNWRPLIAVADLCGGDWPALACQAALEFSKSYREEDPEITCIEHCIGAFKARHVDRLTTVDLLADLHAMDSAPWSEWDGLKGNKPPHSLTRHELAQMLRDFNIKPRVINQLKRRPGDKSARGYLLSEFESAWQSYGRARQDTEDAASAAPRPVPSKISPPRKVRAKRPKSRPVKMRSGRKARPARRAARS